MAVYPSQLARQRVLFVQHRRSVATLRPVEIPPGYWVKLSVWPADHVVSSRCIVRKEGGLR